MLFRFRYWSQGCRPRAYTAILTHALYSARISTNAGGSYAAAYGRVSCYETFVIISVVIVPRALRVLLCASAANLRNAAGRRSLLAATSVPTFHCRQTDGNREIQFSRLGSIGVEAASYDLIRHGSDPQSERNGRPILFGLSLDCMSG